MCAMCACADGLAQQVVRNQLRGAVPRAARVLARLGADFGRHVGPESLPLRRGARAGDCGGRDHCHFDPSAWLSSAPLSATIGAIVRPQQSFESGLKLHKLRFGAMVASPNARYLVTGGSDRMLKVLVPVHARTRARARAVYRQTDRPCCRSLTTLRWKRRKRSSATAARSGRCSSQQTRSRL